MRTVLLCAAIAACALPSILQAKDAATVVAGAVQSKPEKGKKDPNKVVCRTDDVTGSRLASTRTCHTNAEWALINRVLRDDLSRAQINRIAQ